MQKTAQKFRKWQTLCSTKASAAPWWNIEIQLQKVAEFGVGKVLVSSHTILLPYCFIYVCYISCCFKTQFKLRVFIASGILLS